MAELTDKLRSFLGERRYAVLATHDPDGGIHLTPIWFLFEDDRFYFASSSGSRKVKNVERSFSASVVVDAREPGRARDRPEGRCSDRPKRTVRCADKCACSPLAAKCSTPAASPRGCRKQFGSSCSSRTAPFWCIATPVVSDR